jgi:hypothetical protein
MSKKEISTMTRAIASVSRDTGAPLRRLAALTSLWLLAGQFGAAQLLPHTSLEVNMGYLDFGDATRVLYTTESTANYPVLSAYCGSLMYQACIEKILASYQLQQITGVRFQFDMHQALDGLSLNANWFAGLNAFFADLKMARITNITPTIGWIAADWGQYYTAATVQPFTGAANCSAYLTNLQQAVYQNTGQYIQLWRFSPTAPFGEYCINPSNCAANNNCCSSSAQWQGIWQVAAQWNNDSYNCAPANPSNFVGWTAIYSAVGAMLQAASSQGLTVTELDAQNEMTLDQFPVYARLIVDNTNSDNLVLTNLRQAMSNNGFVPGNVIYSVYHIEASTPLFDCNSVYGDSARVIEVSEVQSAIDGMYFGWASDDTGTGGLGCGGTTTYMSQPLPFSQPAPAVIDMHDDPCVGDCDPTVWPWSTVTAEAQIDFSDLAAFRESFYPPASCPSGHPTCAWRTECCGYQPNAANAVIVIGETFGYTTPGDSPACPMWVNGPNWSSAAALNMITGFNLKTAVSRWHRRADRRVR